MNNPLSFTDPSGFSSWTRFRDRFLRPVLAIAVGVFLGPAGYFGAWVGGNSFLTAVVAGFASGGISGGNIQSALQGALSAGIFYGAGTIADQLGKNLPGFGDGGLGRAALHAAAGCASSAAARGSCRSGAIGVGFAEAIGGTFGKQVGGGLAGQVAFRSVSGGVASKLGGGRFENGAMSGAFGYLFNFLAHKVPSAVVNKATGERDQPGYTVDLSGSPRISVVADYAGEALEFAADRYRGFLKWADIAVSGAETVTDPGWGTRDLPLSQRLEAYKFDSVIQEAYDFLGYTKGQILSKDQFEALMTRAQIFSRGSKLGEPSTFTKFYGTRGEVIQKVNDSYDKSYAGRAANYVRGEADK